MQTRRYDCYDGDATVELELSQLLAERLKYLDRFLNHLKDDKPELVEIVIENIQARLEDITPEDYIKLQLPRFKMDLEVLNNYPQLLKTSKMAVLFFLDFSDYNIRDIESITDFKRSDIIRSWFLHYYTAVSLRSIMPQQEAVQYYQSIIDYIVEKTQNPDEHIETIDELRRVNAEGLMTVKATDFIEFKTTEGIFGIKTVRCLWAEVFEELDDPEFADAVACYKDFRMIKNLNENFILTRTQTLVGGKDYCDSCCHDTRIVKTVKHPPKEFWESLT